MRLAVILSAIVVFIAACKKQEDLPKNHEGIFTSKQLKINTAPKMYTKSGEVSDRAAISRYINNLPVGGDYFFSNINTTIPVETDSIKLITGNAALIKQLDKWEQRIVKPRGAYVYLDMPDTIRYLGSPSTSPFDEIERKIGIHSPYYKADCLGTGGCIISYHDATIVTWRADQLILPLISYSLYHSDPGELSYSRGRAYYNNVFSPAVVTLLKDRDTLVVQSFEAIFEKVR